MCNNHEFIEARIFNVLLPDKACVLLHTLHERNAFASIFSFVWIHNNNRYLVFNCPFNLGNHRPHLKRIIQTNTSCPDSCPHSTSTLNQNESPFPYILSIFLISLLKSLLILINKLIRRNSYIHKAFFLKLVINILNNKIA